MNFKINKICSHLLYRLIYLLDFLTDTLVDYISNIIKVTIQFSDYTLILILFLQDLQLAILSSYFFPKISREDNVELHQRYFSLTSFFNLSNLF